MTSRTPFSEHQMAESPVAPRRQRQRPVSAVQRPPDPDETISSIGDLLGKLPIFVDPAGPIWFRGQTNFEWDLKPSLLRNNQFSAEGPLLRRFKQVAHQNISYVPADEWEWLFLMQHHRIPTRLLDWSESPLVALYFAVESRPETDGSFWVLNPSLLNESANISPRHAGDIPAVGDKLLEAYSPSGILDAANGTKRPAACIGPQRFLRIKAQHGVFSVHHQEDTPINKVRHASAAFWTKYRIPKEAKETILKELHLFRINKATIYTDLDAIGEHICKELNVS